MVKNPADIIVPNINKPMCFKTTAKTFSGVEEMPHKKCPDTSSVNGAFLLLLVQRRHEFNTAFL
ncbi:MAG: hypothetical protein NTU43_11940 [Bacteroidetes bacterium]|nr:hypothetical protein [Bacteroidota bacterium]